MNYRKRPKPDFRLGTKLRKISLKNQGFSRTVSGGFFSHPFFGVAEGAIVVPINRKALHILSKSGRSPMVPRLLVIKPQRTLICSKRRPSGRL